MGLRKRSPYTTPWHTFGSCCDSCSLLWWKLIYLVSDPAYSLPLAIMITIQPYYVTDRSRRLPLNENTISRTAARWPQFGNIYDMSYCHNRLNSNIQCNLSSQPSLFFQHEHLWQQSWVFIQRLLWLGIIRTLFKMIYLPIWGNYPLFTFSLCFEF